MLSKYGVLYSKYLEEYKPITGVRIDIWTHLMRECIMKLCTPI